MNRKIKKISLDREAAGWLNEKLIVPSNCFDLTKVPEVDKVIMSGDVISWEIFYQLKKYLPNLEAIVVGNASLIDGESDDLTLDEVPGGFYEREALVSAWIRLTLDEVPAGLNKLDYSKVLIICNKHFYKNAVAGSYYERMKQAVYLIRKQFMENADSFCVYRKKENAVTLGKKLINADYLIVYDDDMVSAAKASLLWYKMMELFGEYGPGGKRRKIICLGGKGPMSKYLYKESEGVMQKNTLVKLFIREEDIVVLDAGNNTGKNLEVLNKQLDGQKGIIVITQRLSVIFKYSQMLQYPAMDLLYFTIYQSLEDSCHLYNGMALNYTTPILHFWAHVIRRFRKYQGIFMAEVPGIDKTYSDKAARLQRSYVIKQPGHRLRTILQLLPILRDLKQKRGMVKKDYENLIKKHQILLKKNFKPLLGL